MSRVRGPLMSLAASGTYAGLITFRDHGERSTAAGPQKQHSPRTPAQLAHTARVQQMRSGWAALTAAQKLQWKNCAATMSTTGYRLYWDRYFAANIQPPDQPTVPCT